MYCGEPVSVRRRMEGIQFCCDTHQASYVHGKAALNIVRTPAPRLRGCPDGNSPAIERVTLSHGLFRPQGFAPRDVRRDGERRLARVLSAASPADACVSDTNRGVVEYLFARGCKLGTPARPAGVPLSELKPAGLMMRIALHADVRPERVVASVPFSAAAHVPQVGSESGVHAVGGEAPGASLPVGSRFAVAPGAFMGNREPVTHLLGGMLCSILSRRPGFGRGAGLSAPRVPVAGFMLSWSVRVAHNRASEAQHEGPFEVLMAGEGPIIRVEVAAPKPLLAEGGFVAPKLVFSDRQSAADPGVGLLRVPPLRPALPAFGRRLEAGGVRIAERISGHTTEAPQERPPSARLAFQTYSRPPVAPHMPAQAGGSTLVRASERIASVPAPADISSSPAPPVFPAVRIPAAGSSGGAAGYRSETWIRCVTRAVAVAGTRMENGGSSVQPRVQVRLPGPPRAQERLGVVRGRYVKSEWRMAALTGAEPLQVLAKGEGLSACEYRTRSML
jgi:hypothetical protein